MTHEAHGNRLTHNKTCTFLYIYPSAPSGFALKAAEEQRREKGKCMHDSYQYATIFSKS